MLGTLRIGTVGVFVGLLAFPMMVWAGESAGGAPLGATAPVCPAPNARLLSPVQEPLFLAGCIQCRGGNITGATQSATASSCSAATSNLDTALRSAGNTDCQNRGYDFVCNTNYSVVITSPCASGSGGVSVGGHAVYSCSLNIC